MNDLTDLNQSLSGGGLVAIEQQRAIAEVQAAMTVAKRFPRDENAALQRILKACQRRSLAESALYAYPRGNETVTGPSIRLAECIAQKWGNLEFGIRELSQAGGVSEVEAYAMDLETNTRQTKIFHVPHRRHTQKGSYPLTDPRDIYEHVANQGARRLRACILGVIPGDVVEEAIAECERTVKRGDEPIEARLKKMVEAFEPLGVSQAQIEKRLNHKLETTSETELLNLRKIYRTLNDGFADVSQFFEPVAAKTAASDLNETLGQAAAAKTEPAPAKPETKGPTRGQLLADFLTRLEAADSLDAVRALEDALEELPTGGGTRKTAREAWEQRLQDLQPDEGENPTDWTTLQEVVDLINEATDMDKLTEAEDLTGELPEPYRAEAIKLARARAAELNERETENG